MSNVYFEDIDRDRPARRMTVLIFLVLAGFFVLAVRVVPVPSRDSIDRSLEVLMLESIEAMADEDRSEDSEASEDPLEQEAPVMGDLDELLSVFTELLPSDVAPEDAADFTDDRIESGTLRPQTELEFGTEDVLGAFGDSRPHDLNADLVPTAGRGSSGWALRSDLLSQSSEESGFRVGRALSSETDPLAAQQGQPENLFASTRETSALHLQASDGLSSASFEALVEWMLLFRDSLDSGVQALLGPDETALTAKKDIVIGADVYDIQLMYAPASQTLHVVLIEGNAFYYFIDPKVQNKANRFEKGSVRRLDDTSEVVLMESEQLSVRSPEAVRFFEIFLSWWSEQIQSDG